MGNGKRNSTSFLMQGSILAMASIISRILGLIYRIPLTDIIGKTGNNYYGTAFEIYNIILIISSYSLPLAVSKLVAARMAKGRAKSAKRVLICALGFALISGGLAASVMFFAGEFFASTLLKTPLSIIALKVLIPTVVIVAVVGVFRGFFQGLHTMIPSAVSQIAEQIVNAIVSVVAAYFLFSYGARVGAVLGNEADYAAAYGAAGGTLGTTIGATTALFFVIFLYFVYRGRFQKKVQRDHSRHVESYGHIIGVLIMTIIPVLLSTTIYNISSIVDNGIFKNIAHLQGYKKIEIEEWWGVFTGQYKVLINVPISIASAMAASCVPNLTAAYRKHDKESVRFQIYSSTRFIMAIAFPCTVGLMVLAQPIMLMLFHDSDPISGQMMFYGGVSVLFYSLSTLSNGLLQGIDKLKIPVRNAALSLVLHIVLLVVLMEFFHLNIFAVVIANAFYAFCMCFLNALAVRKYSGVKQNFIQTYVSPGIASIGMGFVVWLCYQLLLKLLHSNMIACISSMIVGVVIYFILLLLCKGISEEELKRFPKGHLLITFGKRLHLLQ